METTEYNETQGKRPKYFVFIFFLYNCYFEKSSSFIPRPTCQSPFHQLAFQNFNAFILFSILAKRSSYLNYCNNLLITTYFTALQWTLVAL